MVPFKTSKVLVEALVFLKEDLVPLEHLKEIGPRLELTSRDQLGLVLLKEDLVLLEHLKEVGLRHLGRTNKDQLDRSADSNQATSLGQRYYMFFTGQIFLDFTSNINREHYVI